jgi:hypothetical protein
MHAVKRSKLFGALFLLSCLLSFACSFGVSPNDLTGSYTATYPFGREILTLNPDHTFVQQVEMKTEAPTSVQGRWEFDSDGMRLNLHGAMIIDDGFGQLSPDWRTVKPGYSSLSVRRSWSRITIGSGGDHPYIKQ